MWINLLLPLFTFDQSIIHTSIKYFSTHFWEFFLYTITRIIVSKVSLKVDIRKVQTNPFKSLPETTSWNEQGTACRPFPSRSHFALNTAHMVGKIGHKRATLAKVKELPVREFHLGIGRPFKGNKADGEWPRE